MLVRPSNLLFFADRLRWRNRLRDWAAEPMQTGLHAIALLALCALGLLMLGEQQPALQAAWAVLRAHPLLAGSALMGLAALDQRAAQQRLLDAWRDDWLAAEPLPTADRQGYRVWRAARRALLLHLAVGGLLLWLGASPVEWLGAQGWMLGGGIAGALSARIRRPAQSRHWRRSLFAPGGAGRMWRWQRQAAGLALLPRQLAPLLALWLLVPRGPAVVAGIALCLLALGLITSAFARMLGVFAQAQAWLAPEGIAARRWLLPALALPAALLVGSGLLGGLMLWALRAPLPFAVLLAGALMLGMLALLASAAERRNPRRLALVLPLHSALLLACAQSLPPLLPLLWLGQCGWLLHRSLK